MFLRQPQGGAKGSAAGSAVSESVRAYGSSSCVGCARRDALASCRGRQPSRSRARRSCPCPACCCDRHPAPAWWILGWALPRSEEHTSELQSHLNLVCRLLLEKKKRAYSTRTPTT